MIVPNVRLIRFQHAFHISRRVKSKYEERGLLRWCNISEASQYLRGCKTGTGLLLFISSSNFALAESVQSPKAAIDAGSSSVAFFSHLNTQPCSELHKSPPQADAKSSRRYYRSRIMLVE